MSEFTTMPCTKAQAQEAIAHAASYYPDEDRYLTHSYLGPFGADWDVFAAFQLIERADSILWNTAHLVGHHLEVTVKDEDRTRVYYFDARAEGTSP